MNHPRYFSLLFAIIFSSLAFSAANADYVPSKQRAPEPIREFRGAWVATVHNIDWPSRPGLSAGQQQAELIRIFDQAAQVGLNAIVFQVRTECDALYPSRVEPWSHWLTGQMGRDPGYDPLSFAIIEAHRRGLELHAWFNPFRSSASDRSIKSGRHISRTHPHMMMRAGTQVWANPGEDLVQNRAIEVMTDVTRRYDVDGIHIDDYFYPYPKKQNGVMTDQFNDSATYAQYRKRGGKLGIRDWRREEMNGFIQQLYRSIKTTKAPVKFGISPFGIWRPGVPRGIEANIDAYDHLSADSRLWFAKGWVDYMTPQLYWRISDTPHSFSTLASWWSSQNSQKRHLWPGIASSRVMGSEDPGRPASETIRQIDVTRTQAKNREGYGHIHWSFKAIKENRGGLNSQLARSYQNVAIPPASPWLGSAAPSPVYVLPKQSQQGVTLTFRPAGDARWRLIQVQDIPNSGWRTLRLIPGQQTSINLPNQPAYISVRHVGFTGVLSPQTVIERR
ncbi:MAG: family 10 glycosylhydrolase [Verrucomicrobiota bacterium]